MKKLMALAAVAALILTSCGKKELNVETSKDLTIEYGEKLDNTQLFNVKKSDDKVEVKKVTGFDSKKLGKQELMITFTDGDTETEKKVTVEVKDTKKPEITLNKETITITAGNKLDLKDNIKSVKDPVDGDIKYSDKAIEKGSYYIDKGKLDTNKAGNYEIKVTAIDKNGNKTEKSFKVEVKKKEVAATNENNTSANNSSGSTSNKTNTGGIGSTSKPSNSSGNSSSNGSSTSNKKPSNSGSTSTSNSNSGSSSNKKPNHQQQDPNKITRPLGNSGWIGGDDEVYARAEAAIDDPNSPWSYEKGWSGFKTWNLNESMTLWTVEFRK